MHGLLSLIEHLNQLIFYIVQSFAHLAQTILKLLINVVNELIRSFKSIFEATFKVFLRLNQIGFLSVLPLSKSLSFLHV